MPGPQAPASAEAAAATKQQRAAAAATIGRYLRKLDFISMLHVSKRVLSLSIVDGT
jgi:hypothetical protein